MSQVTFGNCLVNSVVRSFGSGKPVSKYAFIVTGSVPQVTESPAAADPVDALLLDEDGAVEAPGAEQALMTSAPPRVRAVNIDAGPPARRRRCR